VKVGVRYHRDVRDDIKAIADFIAKNSIDAALRFAPAVDATISMLSEMPGMGSLKEFDDPRLIGIRSRAVKGFRNHLIFYRRDPDGAVRILAVTHGARNLPGFLLRRSM
jgi:toxin ParE1/3/4